MTTARKRSLAWPLAIGGLVLFCCCGGCLTVGVANWLRARRAPRYTYEPHRPSAARRTARAESYEAYIQRVAVESFDDRALGRPSTVSSTFAPSGGRVLNVVCPITGRVRVAEWGSVELARHHLRENTLVAAAHAGQRLFEYADRRERVEQLTVVLQDPSGSSDVARMSLDRAEFETNERSLRYGIRIGRGGWTIELDRFDQLALERTE